jgi:hypothetical protein
MNPSVIRRLSAHEIARKRSQHVAFARRLMGTTSDAEDITHDAWVVMLSRRGKETRMDMAIRSCAWLRRERQKRGWNPLGQVMMPTARENDFVLRLDLRNVGADILLRHGENSGRSNRGPLESRRKARLARKAVTSAGVI